jgi:ABC-type bacteriocin/lantibiotic exporter with double-glycine peptidase domain
MLESVHQRVKSIHCSSELNISSKAQWLLSKSVEKTMKLTVVTEAVRKQPKQPIPYIERIFETTILTFACYLVNNHSLSQKHLKFAISDST